MTSKVIKVDRVRSVEEASSLEQLGVSMIGVALDPHPAFADERVVPPGLAEEIGRSLSRARFMVQVDFRDDPTHALRRAEAVGADLVQPVTVHLPSADVRAALARAGVGIVYADIEAAHDDDPSWILSRYTDVPDLDAAFFQASFLPEYEHSWEVLRDESPEYDVELQVDDINQLASLHPLLGVFNVTPGNVGEIVAAFPGLRGLAFPLADHATRSDVHRFTYGRVLDVLRVLRRSVF